MFGGFPGIPVEHVMIGSLPIGGIKVPDYTPRSDRSDRSHMDVIPRDVIRDSYGSYGPRPSGLPIHGIVPTPFGPAVIGHHVVHVEHRGPDIIRGSAETDDNGVTYYRDSEGPDFWRKSGGRWERYTPVYRRFVHSAPVRRRSPSPVRRGRPRELAGRCEVGKTYVIPSSSTSRTITFDDKSFTFQSRDGTDTTIDISSKVGRPIAYYEPVYRSIRCPRSGRERYYVEIEWNALRHNGSIFFSIDDECLYLKPV